MYLFYFSGLRKRFSFTAESHSEELAILCKDLHWSKPVESKDQIQSTWKGVATCSWEHTLWFIWGAVVTENHQSGAFDEIPWKIQ